ncbi:MAG: ABC transporter substrate-binding protein [Candidatus Hodarchaeota archaeon]
MVSSLKNIELERRTRKILIIFLVLLCFQVSQQPQLINASRQTTTPLFNIKLIAPTSCPVRMHYPELIVGEFPKIGIDAELDFISWAALGPRVTDQEVGPYADGGYDISFFGIGMGTPVTHQGDNLNAIFGENSIPPYGYNVMYWSQKTGKGYNNYRANDSETLIQKININWDLTEATADFIEWQKIWYDAMPMCVIYNQYEVHVVSKGLYGYNPYTYPLNSLEDVWLTTDYTGTANTVVLAASTGATTFNNLITTDVYSAYVNSPCMDSLYGITAPEETLLPTGTNRTRWMIDLYGTYALTPDSDVAYYNQYPRMAAALGNYTTTGPKANLEYNVSVRDDILWHDGHVFDAWDVAFTFQAALTPEVEAYHSNLHSNLLIPFGENDKTNHLGVYSFLVEDKNFDGHSEHISFRLNQTYGPLELEYIGSLPILPEHILGNQTNHGFQSNGTFDPNLWKCKPQDWESHSFNTGQPTDQGGLVGPIGTGSMVFKSFNPTTREVILEKFENIKWDGSAWVFSLGNSHYRVLDGKLNTMPTTSRIIVTSLDGGLADMIAGDVNILDPQFTMSTTWEELQAENATINSFRVTDPGWQALFFNPKFQQDGVYHLQKKGVRHAISHIIPREKIIEEILRGLGVPAYTPIPRNSWAAIPEADLLSYKKTLTAKDCSTPEKNAKSAYDEYNITIALDWLASEGYDIELWRNPPSLSSTIESATTSGWSFSILLIVIIVFTLFKRSKKDSNP